MATVMQRVHPVLLRVRSIPMPAPTYGEVMWDCGYHTPNDGWGTSGAAPQAAGLAALLASLHPSSTPASLLDHIRATCDPHPTAPTCSGHGVINCARAVAAP